MKLKNYSIFSILILVTFLYSFNYFVFENTLIKKTYSDIIMHFLGIILLGIISFTFFELLLNKLFRSKITQKFVKRILIIHTKNSNIKDTKEYRKIWKRIVLKIESTHHLSLLNKIKELDSYEDINFPQYQELSKNNIEGKNINNYIHSYDFNSIFLNKIREFAIFFEMIYEKYNHKSMYEEYKINQYDLLIKHKKFLFQNMVNFYKMKYLFRLLLDLKIFLLTILPLLTPIYISNVFFTDAEKYNFFLTAILYIAIIYPLLRLTDSIFQIALLYTIQFHTNRMILVHGFYLIILAYCFTLLGLQGIDLFYQFEITYKTTAFGEIYEILKGLMFSLNLSEINIGSLFDIEKKDDQKLRFVIVIKLIILIILIRFLIDAINYFYEKFDQFYYEQKIKKYLLPPELFRLLGLIIVGIIALGYLYLIFIDINYRKEDNISKSFISKEMANSQEDTTLEKLIPFSIFIALIGGILAISTREIMDNYFAGLSLKINPPYEVGNSVRILNYGMLIVKEIGTRSDIFYEIKSNAYIHIPHKKLAILEIKNYTQPTLDYRSEINLNIIDKEMNNGKNIPLQAEKILLMSSFLSTGVHIPIFPTLDETVNKQELDKNKINLLINRLKEYQDNNKNEVASQKDIDTVWDSLLNLSNRYQKQFFTYEIIKVIQKNIDNDKNELYIYNIKQTIISILLVLKEYTELKSTIKKKNSVPFYPNKMKEKVAKILVEISLYYYKLANSLWKLKDIQTSDTQKNTIDNAMIELLTVPRVTSKQIYQDGKTFWEVKLLVTLDLAEQSDETIHHINISNNNLIKYFIDKHFKEKE